jgi:ribosomal protein L37AE/L43A
MAVETRRLSVIEELLVTIEVCEGTIRLVNGTLDLFLPGELEQLLPGIEAHKLEIIAVLSQRGGRIAQFPTCPACRSYRLFRDGKGGLHVCQRCGLRGIREGSAIATSFATELMSTQEVM